MLVNNPRGRITAAQVLEHPWMTKDLTRRTTVLSGALENMREMRPHFKAVLAAPRLSVQLEDAERRSSRTVNRSAGQAST